MTELHPEVKRVIKEKYIGKKLDLEGWNEGKTVLSGGMRTLNEAEANLYNTFFVDTMTDEPPSGKNLVNAMIAYSKSVKRPMNFFTQQTDLQPFVAVDDAIVYIHSEKSEINPILEIGEFIFPGRPRIYVHPVSVDKGYVGVSTPSTGDKLIAATTFAMPFPDPENYEHDRENLNIPREGIELKLEDGLMRFADGY